MSILETYLNALRENRQFGTNETSSYGALERIFEEHGKQLSPKVRCVINPRNRGSGIPDGGFFTADQFRDIPLADIFTKQLPARGAMEVKGLHEDVEAIAASAQVSRYLEKYGLVLVTNYRDFLLLGRAADGTPETRERYRLATSEAAFLSQPIRSMAHAHDAQFGEFLKRVLLHNAPILTPENLAFFLASYARDALVLVERADLPALANLRSAMEASLGITFEGEKGERFFRSTLVQTIFYGVFSAWVLWCKTSRPGETFNWQTSVWHLSVPVIQELFSVLVTPQQMDSLGIKDLLDHTGATLNRVERGAFFARFEDGHAVQYFYEPFLEAFDPRLRKDLGVWYTPPEIVRYMVARVDAALRDELGIADGLADPNVYVLDPCCGTGAYLVEVAHTIARTLRERGEGALAGQDVKAALMHRVIGFEILPAPFVIAHLQVGLALQQLGAPLGRASAAERAGVYLTNALTGWNETAQATLPSFPKLQQESRDSAHVKQQTPILVVLGNPPYNAFAGTSPKEESGLVEPYKEGLNTIWGIKKFNLDDLYIRFFRLAERRIAEMSGKGIVCYISNSSWVKEPSFVVMRKKLLTSFNQFYIENMHGNRKISEYAPDGRTSETVFAIPGFSPGIKQGTAISLWIKTGDNSPASVFYRDDLNAARAIERREQLLASLHDPNMLQHYHPSTPTHDNRYSFRPTQVAPHYLQWPKLTDLAQVAPSNGLMEKRGGALMAIDRAMLEDRMRRYYNPAVSWEQLAALRTGLTEDAARFDARAAREKVLKAESFQSSRMTRYALRPFDTRWAYYSGIRPLWNEPRPQLWEQCWEGNRFLLSRVSASKDPEGPPFFFVNGLSDDHFLSPDAACFPMRIRDAQPNAGNPQSQIFTNVTAHANLSPGARAYLAALGLGDPDAGVAVAEAIWLHALAVGFAPAYLAENEDGVQQDWPRIPLPASGAALLASADLGTTDRRAAGKRCAGGGRHRRRDAGRIARDRRGGAGR